MKPTLCSIITLLTLITLAFVPNSFAQDNSLEYIVRVIYFHPKDRKPQSDIDAVLNGLIKNVQQFYADEMERHGFGRKTFSLETDETGNVIVHRVKGKFINGHYYDAPSRISEVDREVAKQFDKSKNILYLIWIDLDDPHTTTWSQVGGKAAANGPFRGNSWIVALDFDTAPGHLYTRAWATIAHELGHAFGLVHDFRDDHYIMSYGDYEITDQLSYCAAEWLDAHRYFNTIHNTFDQVPTIEILPVSFVSPPNTIRLRFKITHSARLHQAQLLTNSFSWPGNQVFDPTTLIDCKSLNANSTTIEFVTTELAPASKYVVLRVIDKHGNFTSQRFPINMTALLPDSEPVLIPDANLTAVIKESLGLAPESPITKLDMLGLGRLYNLGLQVGSLNRDPDKVIKDLTGLQHATNLEYLSLRFNEVSDITPLAGLTQLKSLSIQENKISDISPLAELTQLTTLDISGNQISDVRPLTGLMNLISLRLANNQISDLTPLAELTDLVSLEIENNQVTDRILTLLTEFPKLNNLNLGGNQIHDIAPLAKLTEINSLGLGSLQISDLTPLKELTNLTHLHLDNNQISDITPLSGLTNLGVLNLHLNQISDLTPLKKLTNLQQLNLNRNRVSNVSSLVGLVNLQFLDLAGNPVKNRKPLLALLRKNPDIKIYLKHGGEPLPVTLSHFQAERTDVGVVIKWTTESELDNAGFYILRSETKNGTFKVVNPVLIQGAGTTSEKHAYTWTDTTAKPNTVYYYQIEDVTHSGVRKQLATVRMRGLVSASGKLTTRWADLKMQN